MSTIWDSPEKHVARQYAVSPSRKPARVAAFLPAAHLWDVKEALRVGAITLATKCYFFESDDCVYEQIVQEVRRMGWETPPVIIRGVVEHTDLRSLLQGELLEYSFWDFCDSLDGRKAWWMAKHLRPCTRSGTPVAMTFSRCFRNNDFITAFRDVAARSPSVLSNAERMLRQAPYGGAGDVPCVPSQLPSKVKQGWYLRDQVDVHNGQIVTPAFRGASRKMLAAAMLAWDRRRVHVETAYEYKLDPDVTTGSKMTMLRIIPGVGGVVHHPKRVRACRKRLLTEFFPKNTQLTYGRN